MKVVVFYFLALVQVDSERGVGLAVQDELEDEVSQPDRLHFPNHDGCITNHNSQQNLKTQYTE